MATTAQTTARRARTVNGIPARFLGAWENPRHPDKFTGQLYQMPVGRKLSVGDYVVVNGPWDTFGVVTSIREDVGPQRDPSYVHLVRGVKRHSLATPVYLWP